MLLSAPAVASDGDVDYSTPYITVDPVTGQLVTKNPGPKLKAHPMDMSSPAETTTPNSAAVTTTSPPANTSDASQMAASQNPVQSESQGVNDKQASGSMPMIIVIVTGVLVFGAVMLRRFRQRQ